MNKKILAAASSLNMKFFLNPEFSELPTNVSDEVKLLCIEVAERINGVFSIGFYEDGAVFLEADQGAENNYSYDEVGVPLEISSLQAERGELFKTLQLWYCMFQTEEGSKARKDMLG